MIFSINLQTSSGANLFGWPVPISGQCSRAVVRDTMASIYIGILYRCVPMPDSVSVIWLKVFIELPISGVFGRDAFS